MTSRNRNSISYALQHSIAKFSSDDCMTHAAALAFYTLFALPPLLFLLVMIVSVGMSVTVEKEIAEGMARDFLQQQAGNLIGIRAASAEIGNIIEQNRIQPGTWWKSVLSLAAVLVAATGLVTALQSSLNTVWKVKPLDGAFATRFLWKRFVSLAMILGFGFLLLVSFLISTVLAAMTHYVSSYFTLSGSVPSLLNQTVSLLTTWAFFTATFRWMPDARVPWSHAALGGLLTVILFTIGRAVLFYYLSTTNPAAQLGSAAGSLVVILLWIYYSSSILLLGAEFTVSLTPFAIVPDQGAVRVEEQITGPTAAERFEIVADKT